MNKIKTLLGLGEKPEAVSGLRSQRGLHHEVLIRDISRGPHKINKRSHSISIYIILANHNSPFFNNSTAIFAALAVNAI